VSAFSLFLSLSPCFPPRPFAYRLISNVPVAAAGSCMRVYRFVRKIRKRGAFRLDAEEFLWQIQPT